MRRIVLRIINIQQSNSRLCLEYECEFKIPRHTSTTRQQFRTAPHAGQYLLVQQQNLDAAPFCKQYSLGITVNYGCSTAVK